MNCWLWIILLLCCGGNCDHSGCGNNCSRNRCNGKSNWNHDRRNCDCMEHDYACGCVTEVDDCGWKNEMNDCGCMMDTCDDNISYDRNSHREDNDCGCHNMPYETFGCQENGIPCPPPIPTPYMR